MNRARTLVAIGAVVVGAGIAWFVAADGASESARFPAAAPEPGPSLPPRAVLAFGTGATDAEAAVVSADGRVEFLDSAKGTVLRTVETGAVAWTRYFRKPAGLVDSPYMPAKYHTPDPLTLAGIPVSISRGQVVAVADGVLREWGATGVSRDLLAAPWLRGARLLVQAGPEGPVFLVLADGRLARVEGADVRFSEAPLPGFSTVLALAGPRGPVLAGGSDPCWEFIDGDSLRTLRRVALHLSDPPVSALSATPDCRRLALATAFGTTLETFELAPGSWRPVRRRSWTPHFKLPSALSVALHPGGESAILAKCLGGFGMVNSSGYHGAPAGPAPSRAIGFLPGGSVFLQGWDDGSLDACSWPGEDCLWRRKP